MKTLNLILITFISLNNCFTQDTGTTDAILSSNLVGTWEHISTTYPSGDVTTYHKEIQFFADGTGICTKFTTLDSLSMKFQWEVKDSIVYLFVINRHGKRIDADSRCISLLDASTIYLTNAYCEEQSGKVCCYRRANMEIAQH